MWPLTCFVNPIPQSGGRAPFPARRPCFGTIVGQTFTHVVQQQIGIRPNQLETLFRLAFQTVCNKRRLMAGDAANRSGILLCRAGFQGPSTSRRARNAKIAAVECDEVETRIVNLVAAIILVPMRRGAAIQLLISAITPRPRKKRGWKFLYHRQKPQRIGGE